MQDDSEKMATARKSSNEPQNAFGELETHQEQSSSSSEMSDKKVKVMKVSNMTDVHTRKEQVTTITDKTPADIAIDSEELVPYLTNDETTKTPPRLLEDETDVHESFIYYLPQDILEYIFKYLSYTKVRNIRLVCSHFRDIANQYLNRKFRLLYYQIEKQLCKFRLQFSKATNTDMPTSSKTEETSTDEAVAKNSCIVNRVMSEYLILRGICGIYGQVNQFPHCIAETMDEFETVLQQIIGHQCPKQCHGIIKMAKLIHRVNQVCTYYYTLYSDDGIDEIRNKIEKQFQRKKHGELLFSETTCKMTLQFRSVTNNNIRDDRKGLQNHRSSKNIVNDLLLLAETMGRLEIDDCQFTEPEPAVPIGNPSNDNTSPDTGDLIFFFPLWLMLFEKEPLNAWFQPNENIYWMNFVYRTKTRNTESDNIETQTVKCFYIDIEKRNRLIAAGEFECVRYITYDRNIHAEMCKKAISVDK